MNYGYIRVSTDKQDTENQKFEIQNFASANNINIDKWVEESISSKKELKKRKLYPLLKVMKKDDLMIACELSRLGRNLMQIMSILHGMLEKECQIWTIKDNYRLGNDISSKVLAFAFGLSAEIERNLISQRTKAALARKKSEGMVLGRRPGFNKKSICDKHKDEIIKFAKLGLSCSAISKIVKVSRISISNYMKLNDIECKSQHFAVTKNNYKLENYRDIIISEIKKGVQANDMHKILNENHGIDCKLYAVRSYIRFDSELSEIYDSSNKDLRIKANGGLNINVRDKRANACLSQ